MNVAGQTMQDKRWASMWNSYPYLIVVAQREQVATHEKLCLHLFRQCTCDNYYYTLLTHPHPTMLHVPLVDQF